MKVYVVYQVDAEPWENYLDGVHKIFPSRESAEKYLIEMGDEPLEAYPENFEKGYFLSEYIVEWDVEDD